METDTIGSVVEYLEILNYSGSFLVLVATVGCVSMIGLFLAS